MSGSANGQVLDRYLHAQFEVIKLVHDNLDAIQAVASHLTPVEDLVDFREEVAALYTKLGILTTASELILQATPQGFALLTAADAAAQRLLLELKSAALREEEYFATATGLAAAVEAIGVLNTQMAAVMADVATRATKVELQALADQVATIYPRLHLVEIQQAGHETRIVTLEDQIKGLIELDVEVDSRLTSLTDLIVGQGSALNGLTSRVISNEDGAAITMGRVTTLETELADVKTGVSGNTTAIQDLTSHTSMLDGVTTSQGEALTELSSRLEGVQNAGDATALAVDNLTTTVLNQGALLSTTSEATTQLASRIDDANTSIANNATAMSSLNTEVSQLGNQLTIASEDVTVLKAELSSPGNLAPNAGFEGDTHGWSVFNRGAGWTTVPLERDLDAATMLPLSMHALSLAAPNQPSGDLGLKCDNLPTRGGQRYILSGWLATLNCTATLEWRLLDQHGQIIQFGSVGEGKTDGGETDINLWPRLWGEVPANNDAREIQIQVWVRDVTGLGPKMWLLRPMLEEVGGLQGGPSAWVPGVTGLARNTAEAMTVLSARIDGVEATASELTELSTGIEMMQSALIQEIISSSNKDASFAAISNDLVARMENSETVTQAAAEVASSMDARVTATEQGLDSQSQTLTALGIQVDGIASETSGVGDALDQLEIRVTETEDGITSTSSALTQLSNTVTDLATDTSSNASAISSLNTRASSIEGVNSSQGTAITSLQNTINNPTTGLSATASAVNSLATRVTETEGDISATASSLSTLSTTVGSHTTTISQQAASINGLRGKVGVSIDANNHIVGWELNNGGGSGYFDLRVDRFRVIKAGQSAKTLFDLSANKLQLSTDLHMGNGRIVSEGGGYMKVTGTGFGVNNEFIEWYGPVMSLNSCSRTNAVYFFTNNGDAYFGGTLSGGVLKNAATSTQTSTSAQVETGEFGTNGARKVVTFSMSYNQTTLTTANPGNGSLSATVVLERSLSGGSWVQISSLNVSGSRSSTYDAELGRYLVRYSLGGTSTYTDNSTHSGSYNYRVRITASSGGWPFIAPNGNNGNQNLSVISIEE